MTQFEVGNRIDSSTYVDFVDCAQMRSPAVVFEVTSKMASFRILNRKLMVFVYVSYTRISLNWEYRYSA